MQSPKLVLDGRTAAFNYQTRKWESDDVELANQLQLVLLNLVGSPNECMQYFVANYEAEVLQWADESLPKPQALAS